ncbi:MAG: transporter [Rhodothermales bacterium]|nr:transporter [Rhodothermales bacterium]
MKTTHLLLAFCLCFVAPAAHAQYALDDVHLFVNFLPDAAVASTGYVNAGITYTSYDFLAQTTLGGSIHIPFTPRFEGAAALQYVSIDPEVGRNRDGISDLLLHVKHHIPGRRAQFALGGYIILPVGDEEVGAGDDLDLGIFGALRHSLNGRTALTATAGLDFFEQGDDYDLALRLGGGIIHRTSDRLALVGELFIRTESDTVLLAGGLDYRVSPQGRLRPGLGIGLSDETADLSLALSYLHSFRNR